MSFITGIAYYLAVYGDIGDISSYVQVGVLAASIFAISNVFRGEYRLPNFFAFRPHARRTIQLWNVTLICLLDARLSGADQRRLFARLDRAVLFRHARRPDRAALCHRARHRAGARRRADLRAAHLPDRHRRAYRRLCPALRAVDARPQHRRLPLPHAGRRSPPRPKPAARCSTAISPRRSPACAASNPTPSISCCRGRRPRSSTAAPRLSWRCRSKSISGRNGSCTNSTKSNWPKSARWRACN